MQKLMIKKYLLLIFFVVINGICLKAQNFSFNFHDQPAVIQEGTALSNAWAGGLNAAQLSTFDANNDGLADLFVFERFNNKVSVFLAEDHNGEIRYVYAPSYAHFFPELKYWALLRDYNCDGKKDIFTKTSFGIRVYKHTRRNGNLSWQVVADPIERGGVNIQVSSSDIPSITDIDGDGDIDIAAFPFSGGSRVEVFKNNSIEEYQSCGLIEFTRHTSCWGDFEEGSSCNQFNYDINCTDADGVRAQNNTRVMHDGFSLLHADIDQNDTKDLLLSHVSCYGLNYGINEGNALQGDVNAMEAGFPDGLSNDMIFPAAFYEDIDQDGTPDLLISPNVSNKEDNSSDFSKSLWLFNHENDTFRLESRNFLQRSMIDVGTQAAPVLEDIDADGDPDLIIGNQGLPSGRGTIASLYLYENTGSKQDPEFTFVTNDYAGLSGRMLTALVPGFADFNGDGLNDLYFVNTNSVETRIAYMLNQGGEDSAYDFSSSEIQYLNVPIDSYDTPCFYDLNNDTNPDMLLGKADGRLEYYENNGDNTYTLLTDSAGGIKSAHPDKQMLSPLVADLDNDNSPELITSDNSGKLFIYENFIDHLEGDFPVPDSLILNNFLSEKNVVTNLGSKKAILSAGHITDNQQKAIIAGLPAGGLVYLNQSDTTLSTDINNNEVMEDQIQIFPNPVSENFVIKNASGYKLEIYTISGQKVLDITQIRKNHVEVVSDKFARKPGIYLLRLSRNGTWINKKIILK